MRRSTTAPLQAREQVVAGSLPRVSVGWEQVELVVGVTTKPLDFAGTPASRGSGERALRTWAKGRFSGVIGGRQVHGTRLFRADGLARPPDAGIGPWHLRLEGYDGFLTAERGVLLTVGVADCVPALLHAPAANAVALLHAGWRGVAGSIVTAALAALEDEYGVRPADCLAWWGPAIGACCYPVGGEVVEAIRGTDAGARPEAWLRTEDGRARVDLRAALSVQVEAHGVPPAAVTTSPHCTSCEPGLFASYRRDGASGGRMAAFAGTPVR